MNRHCGECTLCCRLLPVPELGKLAGERCRHQSRKGCAVYHGPGFPAACGLWSCRWLTDPATAGLRRPDRTGYVIDQMPATIVLNQSDTGERIPMHALQVWCDPDRPDAWRDPALWRYLREARLPMLVRFDSTRGLSVFPPELASDGEWHVMGEVVPVTTRRIESAGTPSNAAFDVEIEIERD